METPPGRTRVALALPARSRNRAWPPVSGRFTWLIGLYMIPVSWSLGSEPMQPIMTPPPEDDMPDREPPAQARVPAQFSEVYPLTVLFWVLGVATVAVVVGYICTDFFASYISILGNLIKQ